MGICMDKMLYVSVLFEMIQVSSINWSFVYKVMEGLKENLVFAESTNDCDDEDINISTYL